MLNPCYIGYNRGCPDPYVKFYLFTKNNTEIPEIVRIGSSTTNSNLHDTAYNSSKPTKIIIHGYSSSKDTTNLVAIRNEYLRTKDYNIFVVDWTALVATHIQTCYLGAVWNVRHVGTCSSQLIQRIRESGEKNIHVIGFSLGGQVSNYITVKLRPYKLPRITGLNPALPLYVTPIEDGKLDRSDADFVDHTNAFLFGQAQQIGHVDFYMKGGATQPGCFDNITSDTISCSHSRAPLYFAESINSQKGFWGWSCPLYWDYISSLCPPHEPLVLMGDRVNESTRGMYYVKTNSVYPFALGKNVLK